jgi:hypothetical protein
MTLLTFLNIGPPVLWRTSRWCLGLATGAVVIACGVALWQARSREPWQRYTIMAFGFLPVGVIYPLGYLRQRRIVGEWVRTGGALCMHCGYDMTGLAPRGTCPECGNGYDPEADAARWAEVGLRRPVKGSDGGPGIRDNEGP